MQMYVQDIFLELLMRAVSSGIQEDAVADLEGC